jgi:RNA-directed DNA polymerase
MPKRIGYLYEQVIDEKNCIRAVIEMTKGKQKNRKAISIRENAEKYGKEIAEEIAKGAWIPKPYKEHIIQDGYRKKERHIKVPCLRDQAVHHAIMRVAAPYIVKRNYFYNCGSIPYAGQIRASRAMQRWMRQKKIIKYCQQLDIRHFYETCPHWAVMNALKRIFKDKRFLALHQKILDSMGDGLAIGFYPSQWYANLVLMWVDFEIKQNILPGCKYVRYMDDMCILHSNKRKLHRAREAIANLLSGLGLTLKRNYQVYKIQGRGVQFLSYRFFYGYTLLKKNLMYRISRKMKCAARNPTLHNAMSVISYMGILKHCNSFNYRSRYVYPYITIQKCKGVISRESRNVRHARVAV